MTDTADLADYVLPATTQLEHLDVHTSYGHTYAMINEPAIAPLGEAKPNTQIFRELAARMGFDDACFGDDDEALARIAFRPAAAGGVDFAELRAERLGQARRSPKRRSPKAAFRPRPARRVSTSPGLGVPDHVANYESAASTPELARRFPLAMISPPARNFLNSSFVNVTSLRAIEGEPVLEISASDAAARGIVDGQRVRIFNDRGSIVCKAVVGERARPGVVNGLGVWWKKLAADGKNGNELTHQRLTDIGRAPSFYDCLVEVEAAAVPAAGVRRGARVVAWVLRRHRGDRAPGRRRRLPDLGLQHGRLLRALGHRPPRAAAGGAAGAAVARRSGDEREAEGAPRALATDPRLRRQRARRARQRELSPLRRPAAGRPRSGTSSPRPSSRWCRRPGASGSSAASATAATTTRRVPKRSPPSCAPKASTSPSTRCRRTRRSAGCRPAAGSPTRCSTPSSAIRKASSRAWSSTSSRTRSRSRPATRCSTNRSRARSRRSAPSAGSPSARRRRRAPSTSVAEARRADFRALTSRYRDELAAPLRERAGRRRQARREGRASSPACAPTTRR